MTEQEIKDIISVESMSMEAGYKTGYIQGYSNMNQIELAIKHDCDCLGAGTVQVDWYMTRSAERKPVIRVKWMFPSYATRKVYLRSGWSMHKKTWRCVMKEEKYDFSTEGLRQAMDKVEQLMSL